MTPIDRCGDGICNCGETCSSCPQDCGPCPPSDPCRNVVCPDDAWHDTGSTRYVSAAQCQETLQKEQEYRDYSCSNGECVHSVTSTRWVDVSTSNLPEGTSCEGGECLDGVCMLYEELECLSDGDCDDNNICTDNACINGTCVFTPNSDPCGEDPCYESFCMNAACIPGPFICDCASDSDCDDGNPCTTQSCANGTCFYTTRDGPCDAGDECTENDYCSNGVCVPGDNICPTGRCEEVWTCTNWSACENGTQTMDCFCLCGRKSCGENVTERDCQMPVEEPLRLNLSAQEELDVGDVLEISVFDKDGNPVEARITLVRPDGSLVELEGTSYAVDQPGEWRIIVEKEGFLPAEGESLVREKPLTETSVAEQITQAFEDFAEFMAEPMRFTLLLVFIIGISFLLIFPKLKKKSKVETL